MFTVTETVSIAQPVEDVFAFIVDARNRPRWDSTVISEEVTSPGPLGVDSTLHSRVRVMGRDADFDWRVIRFDPPTAMAFTSTAGPLPTTVSFELAASAGRSELRATIEASPEGMMRFVEPLIADGVRSNIASGFARLRTLLEADGVAAASS